MHILHRRSAKILPCCNQTLHTVLIKVSKRFSNLPHGKLPLFTVHLISPPPPPPPHQKTTTTTTKNKKLNKLLQSYVRSLIILQHIFCLQTNTHHAARKSSQPGSVVWHAGCGIKKKVIAFLFLKKNQIFYQMSGLRNNIRSIRKMFIYNFSKTSLKKNRSLLCSVNIWICFQWFQSNAVDFGLYKSLQFNITTHLSDSANFHEQLIENKTIMNADVVLPI